MTWVDPVLLVMVGLLGYGGYQRGVVQELFDLLAMIVSLAVALHLMDPLAGLVHAGLRLSLLASRWTVFAVTFLAVAALVLLAGFHVDQMQAKAKAVPDPVKFGLGAILGTLKGLGLAWLMLVTLHHLPLLDDPARRAMHSAPVVRSIQGLQPTFVGVVRVVAPYHVSVWLLPELDQSF